MNQRNCWVVVIAVHTMLILIEAGVDLIGSGESWSLFFSFFLDLPISLLFHSVTDEFVFHDKFLAIFGMHVVLGGIWWVSITCGVARAIFFIRKRIQ